MRMQGNTKRSYVHYLEWEEYRAGMYKKLPKAHEPEMIEKSIRFMENHVVYGAAMLDVSLSWPRTMLHNLTNQALNRLAFLGQCANCYKIKCPAYITKSAWWELSNQQRILADEIARKVILRWELKRNVKQLTLEL